MAAESNSENVDKEVENVPLSPGRTTPKTKRLTSGFSRLNPTKIFGRKKSGKDGVENEVTDLGLVQAVETIEKDTEVTLNMMLETPIDYKDEDNVKSLAESEKHEKWSEKLMRKFDETKDAVKEEVTDNVKEVVDKAKLTISTQLKDLIALVPNNKSQEDESLQQNEVKDDNLSNEVLEEAPSMLQELVQSDYVDINQSLLKKKEEASNEDGEEKNEEENKINEKEDNCVSSLAQGLQKLCAPWSSKKED